MRVYKFFAKKPLYNYKAQRTLKRGTMATVLGNVVQFFEQLGVFDVLLPFLLTFSVMFALLERTKVFGTEGNHSRKNLNAMVSFVVSFLVVASSKLVEIVTKVSSEIVVLLLIIVFFLMLVGSFFSADETAKGVFLKEGGWRTGFMAFVAISLLFIFLDALETDSGDTWLEVFWDWLSGFYTDTSVAAIVLIIFVIATVIFVTGSWPFKSD